MELVKTFKIEINNENYNLKLPSIGGQMLFKKMTGKNLNDIDENDIEQVITLFYCYLKASNKNTFNFEFENFIEIIDNDYSVFQKINDSIVSTISIDTTNEQKKTKV